jgi:hypothetical protein
VLLCGCCEQAKHNSAREEAEAAAAAAAAAAAPAPVAAVAAAVSAAAGAVGSAVAGAVGAAVGAAADDAPPPLHPSIVAANAAAAAAAAATAQVHIVCLTLDANIARCFVSALLALHGRVRGACLTSESAIEHRVGSMLALCTGICSLSMRNY